MERLLNSGPQLEYGPEQAVALATWIRTAREGRTARDFAAWLKIDPGYIEGVEAGTIELTVGQTAYIAHMTGENPNGEESSAYGPDDTTRTLGTLYGHLAFPPFAQFLAEQQQRRAGGSPSHEADPGSADELDTAELLHDLQTSRRLDAARALAACARVDENNPPPLDEILAIVTAPLRAFCLEKTTRFLSHLSGEGEWQASWTYEDARGYSTEATPQAAVLSAMRHIRIELARHAGSNTLEPTG
jgi:hypothetical protein